MEIESKLEDNRIVTIDKDPEVGDLVSYRQWQDDPEWGTRLELGVVTKTWTEKGPFEGECWPRALVYWGETEDEETFPLSDLDVISS
jgi:hypothetical protein|tara:strand:- start:1796 stop:2056 length:261 start_codon:yes stop_codon:yes gene_type:complete